MCHCFLGCTGEFVKCCGDTITFLYGVASLSEVAAARSFACWRSSNRSMASRMLATRCQRSATSCCATQGIANLAQSLGEAIRAALHPGRQLS